jgi:ornithine--oxo-acid transaminase
MIVPPNEYFKKVRKLCTDNGVLLVLDEVQTGLGRTGKLLAEENYDIKADLTILGKALGGGIVPISCVLDRIGGIMDVLGPGDHGSTWGGNPLACAVAIAAIDALYADDLINNAITMGDYLLKGLLSLGLNARGLGLMIGIEVGDRSRAYCEALAKRGVLTKDTHGVIRITPPLCITPNQIDFLLKQIEIVFKE